jgi:hypothetical protein
MAKVKRRPNKASVQTVVVEQYGAIKSVNLEMGANVSVDRFESQL